MDVGLDSGDPADSGDTDLPSGTPGVEDLSLEPSDDVPTVAWLRWTTPSDAVCSATLTVDGEPARDLWVDPTPGTTHEVLIVGVPQDTDVQVQVTATVGDASVTADPVAWRSGLLPSDLPMIDAELLDAAAVADGFVLATVAVEPELRAAVLVDPRGRTVWGLTVPGWNGFRARLAPDGRGIVTMTNVGGDAVLTWRGFDGSTGWTMDVPGGYLDFDMVAPDTAVVLSRDVFDWDGEQVQGDRLVQVDTSGAVQELWRLRDHVDVELGPPPAVSDDEGIDWAHGNYLDVEPDGKAYMTFRNIGAAVQVDTTTGAQDWMIAQSDAEYVAPDDNPLLSQPHSIRPTDDGVLILAHTGPDFCSEVVHLTLDDTDGLALRDWSLLGQDCHELTLMGNADIAGNGNILAVWSEDGVIEEYTSDRTLVRTLTAPFGTFFVYSEHVPAVGVPVESP